MRKNQFKKIQKQALIYIAATIISSALGFLIFLMAYKLHIYFGFPIPGLDGLSAILVICVFVFKFKIEEDLKEKGISIKDAFPHIFSKALSGAIALALVFNIDTIANFITKSIQWFLTV